MGCYRRTLFTYIHQIRQSDRDVSMPTRGETIVGEGEDARVLHVRGHTGSEFEGGVLKATSEDGGVSDARMHTAVNI